MDQDTANSGEGFAPTPMNDILRPATEAPPSATSIPEAAPTSAPQTQGSGETPSAPVKAEQPRAADGKFAPKAEDAESEAGPPPAKQGDLPQSVPSWAVAEERKKRQALERELQELRARLVAPQPVMQQPPQPQPAPEDLLFQNPQAFVQSLRQQQEEALLHTRIATSEAIARQQPDYDAAEQALTAYAQSSQRAAEEVAQALRAHPAPAMWAYQAGKHLLSQQRWMPVMQQHSDPDAFIEAEVERRVAERVSTAPGPAPSSAPLPQSLASARSAGPRNPAPAYRGPTPMSAILGRR